VSLLRKHLSSAFAELSFLTATYLGIKPNAFFSEGGRMYHKPEISSTNGVEIVMSRFNETMVDSISGTVGIGAGLTWDKVYVALESTGVNVVAS
jgi:hypothetical protein